MNDTESKINGADQAEAQDGTPHDTEQEYLKALCELRKGYIWAIVITLAIMAASIATALLYRAYMGLLILALAVIVYLVIAKNLAYSKLGISYRTLHGCLTVTELYGKNRETVYIPEKMMIFTVTEIGTRAFTHESSKSIKLKKHKEYIHSKKHSPHRHKRVCKTSLAYRYLLRGKRGAMERNISPCSA